MEVKLEDTSKCGLEKAQEQEEEQVWECPGSYRDEAAIIALAYCMPNTVLSSAHSTSRSASQSARQGQSPPTLQGEGSCTEAILDVPHLKRGRARYEILVWLVAVSLPSVILSCS